MQMRRPVIVGIGGFTSEVGKTTLLCELLRAFPGWEAIKTTRGHYRSCGKDPHACCVSDLLDEEAVVHSGREFTYAPGKDTGLYWDSGAANVHWVIATDSQVESGINKALNGVQAPGVFIEGNSFTKFIEPDYFVMVMRTDDVRIKTTARAALDHVSAFYASGEGEADDHAVMKTLRARKNYVGANGQLDVFTREQLPQLIASIRAASARAIADFWATPANVTAS